MKPFTRLPAPEFLEQNGDRWTRQWTDLRNRNSGASFNWYQHEGTPVNQLILPILQNHTQEHCSYCDAFPPMRGDDSIDHFLPKTMPRFYHLAYAWENLFVACKHCQDSKLTTHNEHLLRPDSPDYTFDRYFIYKYDSHEIAVYAGASEADQTRARETIRVFDFNHKGHIHKRRMVWELWNSRETADRILDEFNYRFMFL